MSTPTVTPEQNREIRMAAILAELAALKPGSGVGGPNLSEQGRSVDFVSYRNSLLDELKKLQDMAPAVGGPFNAYWYW